MRRKVLIIFFPYATLNKGRNTQKNENYLMKLNIDIRLRAIPAPPPLPLFPLRRSPCVHSRWSGLALDENSHCARVQKHLNC